MNEANYLVTLRTFDTEPPLIIVTADNIGDAHQWIKALMLEWMANRDLEPDDLNAPHIYLAMREFEEGNISSFEIARYLEIGALKWAAMRLLERFEEVYLPEIAIHDFCKGSSYAKQLYVENIASVYEGYED